MLLSVVACWEAENRRRYETNRVHRRVTKSRKSSRCRSKRVGLVYASASNANSKGCGAIRVEVSMFSVPRLRVGLTVLAGDGGCFGGGCGVVFQRLDLTVIALVFPEIADLGLKKAVLY